MKEIIFSLHALENIEDRGTSKEEIVQTIMEGERVIAKKVGGLLRKTFHSKPYGKVKNISGNK